MILTCSQLCKLYYVQSCCYSLWNNYEIVLLILLLYADMNANAEENKFKSNQIKDKCLKCLCIRI